MEKNWELSHLGLVVRDLDKATEYYRSLGIATFEPEMTFDSSKLKEFKVYGKPGYHKGRAKFVHVGHLTIEFIQPLEGTPSPYDEFVDRYGEGINHIGFRVDDLEKEAAELAEKGFQDIFTGRNSDGSLAFIYFDTRKVGNIIIELGSRPGVGKNEGMM